MKMKNNFMGSRLMRKGFRITESKEEIIIHHNNIIVVDKQTSNLIGYY